MQCEVLKFRQRQGGMRILIIDADQQNKHNTKVEILKAKINKILGP